jgi:hypothetical protein
MVDLDVQDQGARRICRITAIAGTIGLPILQQDMVCARIEVHRVRDTLAHGYLSQGVLIDRVANY